MEIVPKRKWQYPIAIEREYAKYLVAYVQKEMEIVESFLPEMGEAVYRNGIRTDGFGDWLGNLVDKVQRKVKQKLSAFPVLNKIFKQVNQHVNQQMVETTESVFGSRPRQFNNTREFETIKTIWTSQNTTLIKSIDQQIMDKLRFAMTQRIIRTADKEQTIADLAKDIQDIAGVAKNRAVLIATDQVGKLNSQLTHYRQFNAGITEYVWNTMKDSRVRPVHASREGRKFKWSDPPADGHPGWAIRCRCTALPVYDTDKMGVEPKPKTYKGLASGYGPYGFSETKMTETVAVDFNDDKMIESMFSRFVKEIAPKATKEYAIVVTRSNRSFWLEGGTGSVDITKVGEDLYGAKVIHNHPNRDGFLGDCFGREDMELLIEYNLSYLDVCSGLGRFRSRYNGKRITPTEMLNMYEKAYSEIVAAHIRALKTMEHNQLEAMKQLRKNLDGLIFEEL